MSTILRALKKVEQASMDRHSGIDDGVGFKSRDRRDDKPSQRLQSRKGPGLIVAAWVGLVLAAVVIYVFVPGNMFSLPGKAIAPVVKKEDKGPSGAGPAKPVLREKDMSAPKILPDSDRPSPAGQLPAQPRTADPENKPVSIAGQTHLSKSKAPAVKYSAPVLSRQPFDIETLPAPVAKETAPVNSGPAKRISEKSFPEKTAPAKADRASPAENVYIQTLERENLKLQAISWSKTPSARVTVINDRVLGEKDTIEGYEIVTINENEIILSDGSAEKFRLAFKNR